MWCVFNIICGEECLGGGAGRKQLSESVLGKLARGRKEQEK